MTENNSQNFTPITMQETSPSRPNPVVPDNQEKLPWYKKNAFKDPKNLEKNGTTGVALAIISFFIIPSLAIMAIVMGIMSLLYTLKQHPAKKGVILNVVSIILGILSIIAAVLVKTIKY